MNFTDTFKSVELVLKAGEVPLLVGETGIGKTSLARELAAKNDWSLVGIDGNLLKEGGNRRPAYGRSGHDDLRRSP